MKLRRRRPNRSTRFNLSLDCLEVRIAPAGLISLGDASVAEGDDGQTPLLNFSVNRSGDLNPQVTVSYHTEDGSAHSGVDYTAESGTVVIPAGSATATISIPITGNQLLQMDRNFRVVLDNVVDVTIPFSLSTQSTFATGVAPRSISIGDLNGDGRPDLILANQNSDSLSLLLNTTAPGATTPSFADQQTVAIGAGTGPVSTAIGDLNGDGQPDLVVTNYSDNSVSILLNTTAPGATTFSFAAPVTFTTGDAPQSVKIADFNGDGKPDLAVANSSSDNLSVLLNTTATGAASPSFSGATSFATGFIPFTVSVADLNGDGLPDLIAPNFGDNSVSVLLNTTAPGSLTPSFSTQESFPTGNAATSVSVSDLNGDGLPDLAVTNYGDGTVSVLLNTTVPGASSVSFAPGQTVPNVPGAAFVTSGDMNGDGKLDLVIAEYGTNNVAVLLNTTAPGATTIGFQAPEFFAVGSDPFSVAIGDLNGDSVPDLATANSGTLSSTTPGTVSVLLNTSLLGVPPSFTVQQTLATGSFPAAVAAGDLNGDGKPDLIVADAGTNTLTVFMNTTTPGATGATFVTTTVTTAKGPKSVAIVDLNGDGKPDLAITTYGDNGVSVLLNTTDPGSTTASFATPVSFTTDPALVNPRFLAVGDLNGDGRPDIAAVGRLSSNVAVLFNTTDPGASTPNFSSFTAFPVGSSNRSVAIGDLNGDGRPDLVVANYNDATVSVLLNTTAPGAVAPSFADKSTFATGRDPYSVAIGDLNGDGKPDLAIANYHSAFISILLNTTAPGAAVPSLAPQQQANVGFSDALSIVIADVNNDGKPDIATANFRDGNAAVFENLTTPGSSTVTFGNPVLQPAGSAPYAVAIADLNGDGRPDVVIANAFSSSLSVILNTTAPSATLVTADTPTFADPQSVSDQPYPGSVGVADLNGDGLPDIAVTNPRNAIVTVLLNNTSPGSSNVSFAPAVSVPIGASGYFQAIGDLNGDSRPDLVVISFSGNLSILLNNTPTGSLTPDFADPQVFPTGDSPRSLAIADINGDGSPDLIFTNYFLNSASVLLNTTTPGASTVTFGDATSFMVGTGAALSAVGDVNGDGRPDLVVIHRTSYNATPGVSVLLNTTAPGASTPSFADPLSLPTGPAPGGLVIADLNGDGEPDVALTDYDNNGTVRVFLNTTPVGANTPSFAPAQTFPSGLYPTYMTVGDLNGDGRPDLIVANGTGSGPLSVLLNTTPAGASTLSFGPVLTYPTGAYPHTPGIADLNGDGQPDLVVADTYDGVSVWLNTTAGNVSHNPSIATGTIIDDDAPVSIELAGGDDQTALVGTAFPTELSVVVKNAQGHVVQGASVSFSVPASGASALFGGSQASVTVLTDADGSATAPSLIANAVVGSYLATAQVEGLTSAVSFHLNNVTSVNASLTSVGWGSSTHVVSGRTNLPWANISHIVVTFNSAVVPSITDLTVTGLGGRVYPVTGVMVVGNTVTWTLGTPIAAADIVTVTVDPRLATYTALLRVLPGDVNDDGVVNSQDLVLVRNAFLNIGPVSPIPSVFFDLNGDGVVDVLDYNIVRKFMGKKLP
jgi:hypothetical protein